MWYVYVLSSKSDGTLYVGSTNDLKRRLEEHRQGRCESTRLRRPLELGLRRREGRKNGS